MKAIQLKMARAALSLGVRDLAEMSGITANTISRIENGNDAKQSTIDALRKCLESAGITFIDDHANSAAGGPGVRLSASPEALKSDDETIQHREYLNPYATSAVAADSQICESTKRR